MNALAGFILGFLVGGFFGVMTLAVVVACREDDDEAVR